MKKKYLFPLMKIHEMQGDMLLETLPVSNTEVEGGLGRGRWDTESDVDKETDSWNDGLW